MVAASSRSDRIGSLAATAWVQTRDLLPRASDYAAMRRNPRRDIIAGVGLRLPASGR